MTKVRTRLYTLAIVGVVVILTAMSGTSARAGQDTKPAKAVAIEIDNFNFGVASIEVAVGTTVTWTNRDDVPHTVVSSKRVFKSPALDTDETFSYTFKEAGTFEYYCSMHPRMTGTIVVKSTAATVSRR
jgi:plastocyanin